MTVVFFCKNFTLISELSHLEGIEEKSPECYTEYRMKYNAKKDTINLP